MKVCSMVNPNVVSFNVIADCFLDYLPEGMCETQDPFDADILFLICQGLDCQTHFEFEGEYPYTNSPLNIGNHDELKRLLKGIEGKARLLFMDEFGVNGKYTQYPDFVLDTDIPAGTVEMPEHPNALVTQFVDSKRFFIMNRFAREVKSAGVIGDHIQNNEEMLVALLDQGVIDKLVVYRAGGVPDLLGKFSEKIEFRSLPWDGMRNSLNTLDYTLQLRTDVGIEIMGIEAGFCGAKPIYPDTPWYRGMFGSDLGVGFFDPLNKVTSALQVVEGADAWRNTYHTDFVSKFDAATHLPTFWQRVKEIVMGED